MVILIGFIGIAAAPFTTLYTPTYPVNYTHEYDQFFVLSDESPTYDFTPTFADKIMIEELTTNGSPVIINLYENSDFENPSAIIQNVTEIRDVFLVGKRLEESVILAVRITRYSNESVEVLARFGFRGTYSSTDFLNMGPSVFLILTFPLYYSVSKNWGSRPDVRGYAIIFVIVISALLIAPLLVYTYNHDYEPIQHELMQEGHNHQFELNASSPIIEFNESVELGDSDSFVKIANFSTNEVPVAITIIPAGVNESLELETVTFVSPCPLQFELPRENLTEFTVRLRRITQDAVVDLSIETVVDVWNPWQDPTPYYQFCIVGIALMVVVLILPRKAADRIPDVVPQ
ncbi:MAG: hypothetical protein ACFFE6_03240 [Candidatus Thorarchaeota archaeon]